MPVSLSELPPTSMSYHLSLLQTKIDQVADRAGVSPIARVDLETCLAALPWRERRHLTLILESVRVHADAPSLHDAVHLMQRLAAQIWADNPPPDLSRFKPSSSLN